MVVKRIYATDKKLSIQRLSSKIGNEKKYYLTKLVHKNIFDCQNGIAYTPLVFKTMQKTLQEVTFPLLGYINANCRKINSAVHRLEKYDYIISKREEPNAKEQEYYIETRFLNKQIKNSEFSEKKKEINKEDYNLRALNFDEIIQGGIFSFFMIGEMLVQPVTCGKVTQELGYNYNTIKGMISGFNYCNLVNTDKNGDSERFSFNNDMDKIKKFFERSKEVKERKVLRMKEYLKAFKLQKEKMPPYLISKEMGIPSSRIENWLHKRYMPSINEKIAKKLVEQEFMSKDDYVNFYENGLIYNQNIS